MSDSFAFSEELKSMLLIGHSLYAVIRKKKTRIHILAIVDDEFIVYKY